MGRVHQVIGDILASKTVRHMPIGISASGASVQVGDTDTRQDDMLDFEGWVTVPAATVLGTGVLLKLIDDAGTGGVATRRCPKGYYIVVTDLKVSFDGATAWTGGTDIRISGSDNSDLITILAAQATSGAFYSAPFNGAVTGVTQGNAFKGASSLTAEKGLNVRATGTFTAGSAFHVYVRGYFAKA